MATLTYPYSFTPATTISSTEMNSNFDAIATQVNGLLDSTNLANGAVTENKLADLSVATAKIQALAVTDAKVATGIDAAKIGGGLVSNTEYAYLNGVTSAIQTQFNALSGRTITAGSGLSGGGDLSADRTIAHAAHTGEVTGVTALTITAGAVTTDKIGDEQVTNAKVASGISASKVIPSTVGSIGSYALLYKGSVAIPGTSYNSGLSYSDAAGTTYASATGTWKAMGAVPSGGGVTLFLRVS